MIQNLSNNVILPLAGAILAIVMTLELIQLITDLDKSKIEEQKKAVRAGYDMDISATRS